MEKNKLVIVHDNGFNLEYKSYLNNLANEIEFIDIKILKPLFERIQHYKTKLNKRPSIIGVKMEAYQNGDQKLIDIFEKFNTINLALFTGGSDVNPSFYGDIVGSRTGVNNKRDEEESQLFELLPPNVLKLGICRGSQFLTVMSGGKLIQHVEGHGIDHKITFNKQYFKDLVYDNIKKKGNLLMMEDILSKSKNNYHMTSTHHQMMYPFNMNKNRYNILAWSKRYLSDIYLNGSDIQMSIPEDFLEPEIVYYPNTKSLCIQGHPEYNHCNIETKNLTLNLIKNYL